MAPRTLEAVQGALYRAVFLVPVPRAFVTPELARERVEAAGISHAKVYLTAEDLPADWPRTARYTDGADGWYLYAEGRWEAPSATVPLPDAAVQVWRDTRYDDPDPPSSPPATPPPAPPSPPSSTPPSPPPSSTPPATPPKEAPRLTREIVAVGAVALALGVTLAVLTLERDDDGEDD